MPFSDYRAALVTGASAGIGAAVAERLAKRGLTVHALARDAGRLEDLARLLRGYETLRPADIADAVEYAIGAPRHVNIGHVEIVPTFQVPGGLSFERRLDG